MHIDTVEKSDILGVFCHLVADFEASLTPLRETYVRKPTNMTIQGTHARTHFCLLSPSGPNSKGYGRIKYHSNDLLHFQRLRVLKALVRTHEVKPQLQISRQGDSAN